MDYPNDLTAAGVRQIYMQVVQGTADPSDVRRVLAIFSEPDRQNGMTLHEATKFLQRRIAVFLKDGTSIESALGLTRPKGRPHGEEETRIEMAAAVLSRRMSGMPHQEALEEVSARFGWGKTQVGEAWKLYKMDALLTVRLQRAHDKYPWSEAEVAQLRKIFKKDQWFTPPE